MRNRFILVGTGFRSKNRTDEAREPRLQVFMANAKTAATAEGFVADDAGFAQHFHEMGFGRFRHGRIGELALRHLEGAIGKLADDLQSLGITQRKQHLGQAQRTAVRMWKVRGVMAHGSILVEPSVEIQ